MHSLETIGRQIIFFFTNYVLGQRGARPHALHASSDTF